MSHIFISYSRQDQAYVTQLAQALESHRLPLWLDDRINYGSEWPREIQKHLDTCLAFVLVMSPRSRESRWVSNELTRAIRLRKPIFPLWLEGDIWFEVESYQAFDVRRKNVPPVRFFNDLRPYFSTSASTSSTPQTPPHANDLSSEKGIDYTRLRDLLKAQDWRAADRETYETMIRAVGKKSSAWFTDNELLNFPCTDLCTIDRLWVKYSQGKFGFSVQKKIWQECGSPRSRGKDWDKFCFRVGWQNAMAGDYLNSSKLKANPQGWLGNSPAGEFPILLSRVMLGPSGVVRWLGHGWDRWGDNFASYLFSRIDTCKL